MRIWLEPAGTGIRSDIFDAMHRAMFDQLFSLDEEGRKAKAQLFRVAGLPEETTAELTRPGIQAGTSFGGAKPVAVMSVVGRVLFGQKAGSVLLRVTRPPFDEAGHVEVAVLEVGSPSEGPRPSAGNQETSPRQAVVGRQLIPEREAQHEQAVV